MPEWDADVEIGEPLVRALLQEQFPELDASSARLIGEGWDNSVWVVEDGWAFRFPRREIAILGVRRELALLPRLAPLLPVPIPVPTFVGRPSERFPWPFFGAPLLPGREPADTDLTEYARHELAAALGQLLRVLHSPETRALVDPKSALPVDFNRRADMAVRVPRARENIAMLQELGLWRPPAAADAILVAAAALPAPSGELVLAHGDLHVRHVLVTRGAVAGVIDWGDVCLADACIDLMLVWSLLPPAGRERFFAEYGPVSDEQLLRARLLALVLDSMLVRYAHDAGNPNLKREALAGLDRTLVE
jgi:aminoglycoside phosphotransferase (APT) family kinase protein